MEKPSWQEGFNKVPRFVGEFELEVERTALLLIDMQYSSVHPDYGVGRFIKEKYPDCASYYFSRLSELVVPNQRKLLDFFREKGLRVIYVTLGPMLPDHSDYKRLLSRKGGGVLAVKGLLSPVGTFEHGILEEIKPRQGELVINKVSGSAFTSTGFDQILRNLDIVCLVIAGVVTHACIETTARDAADRGYACVLVDDGCATYSQELHNATMRSFAAICGRVQSTGEIIDALRRQVQGKA